MVLLSGFGVWFWCLVLGSGFGVCCAVFGRFSGSGISNASGCDLLHSRGSFHEDCGSDLDILAVFVFSVGSTVVSTVPSLDACNEARTVASELIPRIPR